MKAIAALLTMLIGAAIAGCAPDTPLADANSATHLADSIANRVALTEGTDRVADTAIRWRMMEYATVVANADTTAGFTAFIKDTRAITVQPSSAAEITVDGSVVTFPTPVDRQRWIAQDSPPLTAASRQTFALPPDQFSFISQGHPLTYRLATELPGAPDTLSAQITRYLAPDTSAATMLWQLGYLLRTAPLSAATRSAAWQEIAALPGLRLCGLRTDLAGRRGQTLCVKAAGEETDIIVNADTGSLLAIEQRILSRSPWYPDVPAGSLIRSNTFDGS